MADEEKGRNWKDWAFLAASTLATYWLICEEFKAHYPQDSSISWQWSCVKFFRRVKNWAGGWETRLMDNIDHQLDNDRTN